MLQKGIVEKKRLLPYRGQVLVSVGDRVDPWTPVAKIGYLPGKMTRVDVARELAVPPARVVEFMVKKSGDAVKAGEVLAQGNLFWEWHACKSPVSGIVGLVSRYLGHAYVREPIDLGHTEPQDIDVAGALGVSPFIAMELLNVSQGKMVSKDQPIASRRRSWGEPVTYVMAPTFGTITKIDRQTGHVTIVPLFRSTDVLAYVAGTAKEVLPDEGVIIETDCTLVNGVFGVGGEAFGELCMGVSDPSRAMTEDDVSDDMSGKVVVAGATTSVSTLKALAAKGAKAVIVGYLPVLDIQEFVPGVSMGITGKEDVPLTLVITEGFRPGPMAKDVFSAMAEFAGKVVSCDGTTHIRAGVIRPEVIMPRESVRGATAVEGAAAGQVLKAGMRVRLLRRPFEGQRGVIRSLDSQKTELESGIITLTFQVMLDDGRTITVPRSNCIAE
jgi:hypothetical protein